MCVINQINVIPLASLFVSIIVAFFVYRLNKLSGVEEYKMIFYNNLYHDLLNNQLREEPAKAKNMVKNIEIVKFIIRHENLCKSDKIWDDIKNSVHFISRESFLPDELKYEYEHEHIKEECVKKIFKCNDIIIRNLRKMKNKYENSYYNQ